MTNDRSRTPLYFALPALLLAACVLQPSPASAQMTSTGIDCSQVQALQLLKQDNMGAGLALIECGIVGGGQPARSEASKMPAPPNIRVSNRACTSNQSCTKSENMVWASTKDKGQTIVVNYNDSAGTGSSYTGTSYSTDGGATFKEIQPAPFLNGHGTNYGDPIVVFNSKLNMWFAGDIATSCGGFGIGLWTSTNGKTWTTGACAHNGGSDDRESMWVDNEPTSGTYGRMYVVLTDFTVGGGALSVVHSDNGTTWSAAVVLNQNFVRPVQITGSPRGAARFEGKNSTVFVASMDEGGGSNSTRQNIMYKSLDGGVTWTSSIMAPRFNPVGDSGCATNGYFYQVNPIIRHMGWGEPAVGPSGVVHYVYAGAGTGSDHGDIFYQRSKDNGKTWSKPKKLNTDADAQFKEQWMPSLSATSDGKVTAAWYDRRKATSACNNVGDAGCNYERIGRQSTTNGASWMPEFAISTKVIPQPAQPDPTVQQCYAGDYDYNTALNGADSSGTGFAYVTWTDGRRLVGGTHVQDVDFAKVPLP